MRTRAHGRRARSSASRRRQAARRRFAVGGGIDDRPRLRAGQAAPGRARSAPAGRDRCGAGAPNLPALTGADARQHGKALVQTSGRRLRVRASSSPGPSPSPGRPGRTSSRRWSPGCSAPAACKRCSTTRRREHRHQRLPARLRRVRRRDHREGPAGRGVERGARRDDPDARRPRGTVGPRLRRRQRAGQPAAPRRLPALRRPVGDQASRSSRSEATAIRGSRSRT